jgi:capsular polysaccharide export protein
MGRRVRMDLVAHAANIAGRWRYPHYRSHRPAPVWQEAKGWVTRGWNALAHGRENDRTIAAITRAEKPYFLVPLQLNSDYQIRRHSRFTGGMPEFIREVLTSFAAHAGADTRLFFKNHPLDNGIIDYRRLISAEADARGISDRVLFAAGGDLDGFLRRCKGAVLCNSTVGFAAVRAGTPMKVLGQAIYGMDGLTDQQPLGAFWQNPVPPQQNLAKDFLTVVETYTQVRGDLFSSAGISRAADEAALVINGHTPRLPDPALADPN